MAKQAITNMKQLYLLFFLLIVFVQPSFGQMKFGDMELPVRVTRTVGVTGNIGLKSLTGLGVSFQYYVLTKFAIDGGVGISNYGYNLSGRGRYIFLKSNFSPFVAAGFIYGTGSFNQIIALSDITTSEEIWLNLYPSRFLQLTGGAEYLAKGGFFLMFNVGISILLNNPSYEVVSGNPSPEMNDYLNFVYGTGFSTEVSIGYIFGNKKGYRGQF